MATWTPDPTFYPSPTMAMAAPRETLGYVAILNPDGSNRATVALIRIHVRSCDAPAARGLCLTRAPECTDQSSA